MSFLTPFAGVRLFGGRHPESTGDDRAHVIVETLGREHAGKTGIRAMKFRVTQQGPMPSGLELSAADPRTTPRWMNEAIAVYRGLQKGGFTSTIDPTQVQYHLFEADQLRAVYSHRESIGQLLTFTQDNGDKKLQEHFGKHHDNLARAGVIHLFISCPPDDRPESIERLQTT
jgi:hypothetical protein